MSDDPVIDALEPDPDEIALVTARLVIASYLRPDGSHGYLVSAKGDMPATSYLGLTVIAQRHITEWGEETT